MLSLIEEEREKNTQPAFNNSNRLKVKFIQIKELRTESDSFEEEREREEKTTEE